MKTLNKNNIEELKWVLECLDANGHMFALIDEYWADIVEDEELFSLENYKLTSKGLDFLRAAKSVA